jgi:hypothetical protein
MWFCLSNPQSSIYNLKSSIFFEAKAEREGFEPPVSEDTTVFETAPINQTPAPLHLKIR